MMLPHPNKIDMMSDVQFCQEQYGSSSKKRRFIKRDDGAISMIENKTSYKTISQIFRSVFLPQGYPESVSDDYVHYQVWDSLQAFASSINGALAGQAVLKGVGVGDEKATVIAATMTWLLKHGVGMIGSLIFTWLQGTSLDCNAKRWRMFADIMNDSCFLIEILAPLFPLYFIILVCFASIGRSLVGVAGGATRAAFTQHQARRNNMADVSAKDGSQETLVNLLALLCNLIVIPLVNEKQLIIWSLFLVMTLFHVYANYRAVRAVVMETINQARLKIIIERYIDYLSISPKAVNLLEPVFVETHRTLRINLGVSLCEICNSEDDLKLFQLYRNSDYILGLNLPQSTVSVVLHESSTTQTQLMACFHAEILNYVADRVSKLQNLPESLMPIARSYTKKDVLQTLQISYGFTHRTFPTFLKKVETAGWLTDSKLLLGADEWRSEWTR